jgi:hypothetical protein
MSPVEIWGMANCFADEFGLRTLAGAGRAQQNQLHEMSLVAVSRKKPAFLPAL